VLARLDALPRDTRDTLFLLGVIAWVLVPQVANLPVWCSLLAAAVLLWRGWLTVKSKPLPGKWWLIGLLFATMGATFATHRTLLGRDAGVTLIVVLLALKTLELRARRDAFVIFFLGFFTMLTNFFFSQSLPVAAAMLVALLGLLTALVNAHMPVGKPPLARAARTAATMALLGAPIMAVLFVLFPRLSPLWGIPSDAMSGRSGLSANMQVGNIASLALDDTIAMRIKFQGDRPPPQTDLYFRGPVLSSFDGREWRALQPRLGSASGLTTAGSARLQVSGGPVRYEVTMEPSNRPWLMVLDAAQKPPEGGNLQAFMTSELQWIATRPVTDLLRFRVESYPTFRYGPQRSAAALPPQYTELPPGFNPRTRQLAYELRTKAGAGDNAQLVQAAMQLLRTGNYQYTLDPGVYGEHTADEFWFDRKQGFCEHIASAFVVLMRMMDIPSRVVTGYQGGERNSVDGYWVLRQSDAHAWAEVWLQGRGWVRVDPTSAVAPGRTGTFQRLQPPRGAIASALADVVTPQFALDFRAVWDALNNSWNQWVLNYTQSKQLDLLKNLGFESPSWEDLSYVLIAIVVLAALVGAAWTLWDRRQHDPWLRLLARTRRRLHDAGLEVPATAPPRQIATLVTARFGDGAQPLAHWLLALESQRYAKTSQASLAALQREFRNLTWPHA
jgi:transglutaminase-like putative cysteine protease